MSESRVSIRVNGADVEVEVGVTILDACTQAGIETPTICYGPTTTPPSACRACVVEVEGSRALVPSCSRAVEDGMVVHTDSERVRDSRRMVLELLSAATDLSQAPDLSAWASFYGVDAERYPDRGASPAPLVHDKLYVRDYDKCVLCYKCVEACGDDAQRSYAISVAGRGDSAQISTEYEALLPESACVYCGNCIAVCPTNALQFHSEYELREAGEWRPESQAVTTTVCSYCGVGCNLELHVQDNEIVKVTSPSDHDVTEGNLCIKGRFGWTFA
jgi:predicted molibdopterin-dependent oxidoreductase YjgC